MTDYRTLKGFCGVQLYQHMTATNRVRAQYDLNCSKQILVGLLLDSSKYHEWMLGSRCTDSSRLDSYTELFSLSIFKSSWLPLYSGL